MRKVCHISVRPVKVAASANGELQLALLIFISFAPVANILGYEQVPPLEEEISLTTNGATLDETSQPISIATSSAGIAGYLFAEATNEKLNLSNKVDATLASVLERNGPDMRPMRTFEDFDDITLDVAKRAWKLMHDHAQAAATDRLRLIEPIIVQTLKDANVSSECLEASQKTMQAGQRLQSWAIQLLSAWGNFPPTGFFEGTLGDIGSFHGCVNVPQNQIINHAHYCTIAYRPVMPYRRNFEIIVKKEPDELLRLFDQKHTNDDYSKKHKSERNEDAFTDILSHAQYNHYVYYKFGTCFPIQCNPYDVHKLAKLVGKKSILMSGPVKCHSKYYDDYEEPIKHPQSDNITALQISTRDLNQGIYIWKPHITQTQWVSLIIIGSITSIIIFMTFIDIVVTRLPNLHASYNATSRLPIKASLEAKRSLESKTHFPIEMNCHSDCKSALIGASLNRDPNNNSAETLEKSKLTQSNNDCRDTSNTIQLHEFDKFNSKSKGVDESDTRSGKASQISHKAIVNQPKQHMDNSDEQSHPIKKHRSLLLDIVDDYSIITNVRQFFRVSQSQLNNDILCINGIRCITMSWIIVTHTMQYNDWSAFARIYEVETHLKSLINQPLFNGSYLVDTFFLMSGLLTSFSSFRGNCNGNGGGLLAKFSPRSYLMGRYLRLTPQIMLISMLFILLPQLSRSGGPHWYTITGEYSENCSQNWWISLLYIQAFYRSNEMCNFVCWWISVDMFYHLFALAIILIIYHCLHLPTLASRPVNAGNNQQSRVVGSSFSSRSVRSKAGSITLLSCSILILSHGIIQVLKHYQLELPPNLLSTIPQSGAMWSKMTLEFFWTPYAHAFPFFLGFYIGYLMAQYQVRLKNWFNLKRALIGWTVAISLIIIQSYSTYFWVIGRWQYSRLTSTIFYLICPIVWSSCLTWIILACHYGYGSWINQLLSCKLFIILGKASYIVYLSHFLVLFTFFGSQNLLLEPTQLMMFYVIIGNICLSMLLGSVLCIVYEMPWLKTQKRLMKYIC